MKIRKYFIMACSVCTLAVMLTACDIPGVTASRDDNDNRKIETQTDKVNESQGDTISENQTSSKEASNTEETRGPELVVSEEAGEITDNIDLNNFDLRSIPKDKVIYKLGEVVSPMVSAGDIEGNFIHFKINSATVYEHVKDADIDESKIDDEWDLFDGECAYGVRAIKDEESMEAKFLLCDMDLEYEQAYMDFIKYDNITRYALVYVQENGNYVMTGYPIYLSVLDTSKPEHTQNSFDISAGKINLQVGWVVDKNIFNVEKFDMKKLYICVAPEGDEMFQEFVYLGLSGED